MNQDDMAALDLQILECRLCPLCKNRNLAVPGSGPSPAKIMLVGEAPGREEDMTGKPFVGRAGKLLNAAIDLAGLVKAEIYITSVIKCRPPENRKPKKTEIALCSPYLKAQMNIVRPKIICLMGNTAAQAVLGMQGITALRGRILNDRFLVTYHPAAVLRNRNLMGEFVSDLKRLNNLENHELQVAVADIEIQHK
jgi:DNA polymerase